MQFKDISNIHQGAAKIIRSFVQNADQLFLLLRQAFCLEVEGLEGADNLVQRRPQLLGRRRQKSAVRRRRSAKLFLVRAAADHPHKGGACGKRQ